jgi:hypothetical protein
MDELAVLPGGTTPRDPRAIRSGREAGRRGWRGFADAGD